MVKARLTALSFAGIILVFDQISKYWAAHVRPDIQVIPGLFNLIYVENTGAAFGILRDQQLLLVTIKLIAIGVLLCLIFYEREERKGFLFAFAMILSGTCGNLIDRVRLGYVVDFLDVYVNRYHWPTFNVADSSITVGVIILIFTLLLEEFHVTSTETQQK